ncbi:dipeptidyl peptidase III [Mollisia scopiformis]|uniref:Dipeptidyl peptidase III n=1 Tax=Mollisia scopiformis TaxID=149040 RepID=A0A194WSA7_MOLSC|nr:dipeptidyl peptidase III [Mollisia scopiformis]KUJ10851.1 dipeptidyl peptidase III [Mollisia scopiformis]
MSEETQYATAEPLIRRLEIKKVFEQLTPDEKLYAHYSSRAAWAATRIILRQVSPEAEQIYKFILELHKACNGKWESLLDRIDLKQLLGFAAIFLANIGNYGYGDQKFVPRISRDFAYSIASAASENATSLLDHCIGYKLSQEPHMIGYTSATSQNQYFTGDTPFTQADANALGHIMDQNRIGKENTRVQRIIATQDGEATLAINILQASVARDDQPRDLDNMIDGQRLEPYKDSQRLWVKDKSPVVETIFGFVEPYRDPAGTRAEFEGIVTIVDKQNTKALRTLVEKSLDFTSKLPWVEIGGSHGEAITSLGPFENASFESPDFTSVHALTYCSTIIFLGINLPNFEHIRENDGFKNLILANREIPADPDRHDASSETPFIDSAEVRTFISHHHYAWNLQITIHELLGHGTGRMITEDFNGKPNFNITSPPISPLTQKPIKTWYKKGETWTSVFGKLATTIEECRAEALGVIYNQYLHFGVLGVESLKSYDPQSQSWGQPHERGHFAMIRVLMAQEGFMKIDIDESLGRLIVRIDRTKILSHGKKALGELIMRLHVYRCTADINAARAYYEGLTHVDDYWLTVRDIVKATPAKTLIFLQANTFIKNGKVLIKEYEPTVEGVIQSWADREY